MTLKTIKIYSIRGIKELDLEIGSRGAVIYGENGTGKSSIVDAIEYFFSGSISHLKSAKTLSVKDYGTHIYRTRDPEVSLIFSDDTKVTRTFDKKYRVPASLQDYFKGAENGKIILRRSQILDFIHDQPSNRYKSFGGLIGLETLEEVECCFERLSEKTQLDVEYCTKRIKYEYDAISELLNKRIENREDVLRELNYTLEAANLLKLKSLDEVLQRKSELMALHFENYYNKIFGSSSNLGKLESLDSDEISYLIFTFRSLLTNFYRKSLENYSSFFLQTAHDLICQIKEEKCPVCDQDISREKLLQQLNPKIKPIEEQESDRHEIPNKGLQLLEE